MVREKVWYDFPKEWVANLKNKLCPPCGKPKHEFAKRMRIYCSPKCREEYYSHIHDWSSIRDRFMGEKGDKCAACGISGKQSGENGRKLLKVAQQDFIRQNGKEIENLRLDIIREADNLYNSAMNDQLLMKEHGHRVGFPGDVFGYKNEFRPVEFEVDHKIAIVNGGHPWKEENLQVLCTPCHLEKTKKDVKSLHND